eukprot:1554712-Ditylum_brightwellii.AAC.1
MWAPQVGLSTCATLKYSRHNCLCKAYALGTIKLNIGTYPISKYSSSIPPPRGSTTLPRGNHGRIGDQATN